MSAPDLPSKELQLYCPECGHQTVRDGRCQDCAWVGCDGDDHSFKRTGADPDVGLAASLTCGDCGLEIDDDGRFDQDWDDNV